MDNQEKIKKLAERASILLHCNPIDIQMDLTFCIEGGCDLRLDDMLNAKNSDFLHDIIGINHHLNHETFQLERGFWPRFAK